MKRVLFLLFAFLLSVAVQAANTGGVSDGLQVWDGKKVFLDNVPNVATLTGAITLYVDSKRVQRLDPGGANRDVTLPAVGSCKGYEFFIVNTADAAENLVVKNAGGSTIVTINQNEAGYAWCDGTAWYGFAFSDAASGFISASGTVAGATSQAQDFGTNGVKADIVTGSSATTGNFNFNLTDNLADGMNIKEGANSYLKFVTTNSSEKIQLGKDLDIPAAQSFTVLDNNAAALAFKEGSNSYITLVTTNSSESVAVAQRLTTTDGVSSGTARVIGGRAYSQTAAGTAHTGSTDEAVLGSYTIPANTIKQGTVVKVRYQGIVTADNGATTLTVVLKCGPTTLTGQALVSHTATDTSANHIFTGYFELVGRAAPGAAAACVGTGYFSEPGAAGGAFKTAFLGSTNFATNGNLLLEVTGDWSAADANSVRLDVLDVVVE